MRGMIVLDVFKTLVWLFSLVFFASALAPVALGAVNPSVPTVNSPMTEPQPSSGVLYIVYYMPDAESHYRLNQVIYSGGSNLRFTSPNLTWFFSDGPCTVQQTVYDIETGSIILSESETALSYNSYQNYYQKFLYGSQNEVSAFYFILPSEITNNCVIGTTNKYSEPFVTWSSVQLEQIIIRSHLETPVCDDQNYYYVEVTEDNSFLYWFSVYQAQMIVNNNTLITGTIGTETVHVNGLSTVEVCHLWKLNIHVENNTTRLIWRFDPDFDPYSQLDYNFVYQISCAKYDLVTGDLVSLNNFSGERQNISSFELLYTAFELPDALVSIRCYGVSWFNNSRYLVNVASIVWGVDPVVDHWRDSVLSVLQDIRDAIVGDGQELETVTVPIYVNDVQSVEEELYNGVAAVTDPSGGSIIHGGGGRLFDSLEFGEGLLTPLSFFREFYNSFIEPHSEIVFLLTFLLIASTIVVILGKHIKL